MRLRGIKKNLLIMMALFADDTGQLSRSIIYNKMWWRDYKYASLAQTAARLVKRGFITREVDKKGNAFLKLISKGGKLLDEVLPLKKLQEKKWDGKWRLVIFDIPEKNRLLRNNVRNKLKKLGFGMWQKSVYVTPHGVMDEMNEFLQDKGLFPGVVCFESQRIGHGNDREFAQWIFNTEALNDAYRIICEELKKINFDHAKKETADQPVRQKFRVLWMRYLDLVSSDPFLPLELLPQPWYADEARENLKRLIRQIK